MTMKKGQMTVIGLIMIVVALIVLGAFLPVITETINVAGSCVTGNTLSLLQLLPFFFVLAILISIVIYATGGHQQQRQY